MKDVGMAHWVLIGDASGVRIFSTKGRMDRLEIVKEIPNPEGRKRTQELVSDEPGRVAKGGASRTKSAMDPRTNAHEEAAIDFARSVSYMLDHELQAGTYSSLSVVAPAHFLGLIRSMLSKKVAHHIHSTLTKDLVNVSADDLPSHLEPLQYPGHHS
jgi:protein required for attachment to host cells